MLQFVRFVCILFFASSAYATDNSLGTDVVLHVMDWFKKNDSKYVYFILLQPTSPFRKVETIKNMIKIFNFNSN